MIGSASNSSVGASSAVTYLKSNVNLLHGTDGYFLIYFASTAISKAFAKE